MKKKSKAHMKPLQKLIFITVSLRHFYETLLSTRIDKVQIFLNMMIVASLASAIAAAQVVLDDRIQQPVITTHAPFITKAIQPYNSYMPEVSQPHSIPATNIQAPTTVSFVSRTGPDAAMAPAANGVPSYSLLWNTVPTQISPFATGLLPGLGLAGNGNGREINCSEKNYHHQMEALPVANAYGRSTARGS